MRIVLDNYSMHKSGMVKQEQAAWTAARIEQVYMPAYSPQLSAIESMWNDFKQRMLPIRSYTQASQIKQAVDSAFACRGAAGEGGPNYGFIPCLQS